MEAKPGPSSSKKREREATSSDDIPSSKKARTEGFVYLTLHVKLEASSAERTFIVGTHETFSCLAEYIIQTFSYDIQRIYSFHMDGEPFSPAGPTYFSPIAEKEPSSESVLLAEISWFEGQKFLLLYDYAECHNFMITVNKVCNN